MKRWTSWAFAALIILCIAGCQAYTPHETTYKGLIGTWVLDSVYIDAKPVKHDQQTIAFTKDENGTIVTTTIVKDATYDNQGNLLSPTQTAEKRVDFNVKNASNNDGNMTITSSEGSVNYEFSIDKPAQIMHLYTKTEDGRTRHEIYVDASVIIPQ